MTPAQWLTKIRKLCLSLPGTTEKVRWGHPTWDVGCLYAGFGEEKGRPALSVMANQEEQSLLVLDDRLFVPPYVGGKGWVGDGLFLREREANARRRRSSRTSEGSSRSSS